MRFLAFPLFAAFAQSIALSWAVPIIDGGTSSSALASRGERCYNAPNTIAGTHLSPRAISHHPRVLPGVMISQIWCAPGSSTYVIITWASPIAAAAVNHLLDWAHASITNQLQTVGDGLLQSGTYQLVVEGVELVMQNANNHQQTWGVVNSAITALAGFQMTGSLGPRAVHFRVFEGMNCVGVGYMRNVPGG